MSYRLKIRDKNSSADFDFDDVPDDSEIEDQCEDWVGTGEWGDEGAEVVVWWTLYEVPEEDEEEEEIDSGSHSVNIEPNHDALIKRAGGDTDCDHDWTGEGHGGCDENPGVWSGSGTTLYVARHCRKCGLHCDETKLGAQRNPREHDTVEYRQPDNWCEECQSEECQCKENEE